MIFTKYNTCNCFIVQFCVVFVGKQPDYSNVPPPEHKEQETPKSSSSPLPVSSSPTTPVSTTISSDEITSEKKYVIIMFVYMYMWLWCENQSLKCFKLSLFSQFV